MRRTFAISVAVVLVLVGIVAILILFQKPLPTYTIEFKNGETVSCDHVDYKPGFVICTMTDSWTGNFVEYNSYPANSVLGVESDSH